MLQGQGHFRKGGGPEKGLMRMQKSWLGAHLWDGVCCGNGTAHEN